jgi:TonB family protein
MRPEPLDDVSLLPSSEQNKKVQIGSHLGKVASTLAAQGLESTELALDLILHDLAERARLGTDASGAAIALERGSKMVCRAAAGATAPDLGVQINTESGLTGACIRERKRQWCSDTESDPRVNAEACRQLGVRSMVVVPLFVGHKLVGVFEILSAQADAFGEQDLTTLQEVAQWVSDAIQSAQSAQSAAAKPVVRLETTSAHAATPLAGSPAAVAYPEPAAFAPAEQEDTGLIGAENSTRILRATVLALATLLLVMLGFKWGWQKAHTNRSAQAAPPIAEPQPAIADSQPEEATLDMPQANSRPRSPKPSANKQKAEAKAPAQAKAKDDQGDLVVTQDGKVVFEQKAANPKDGKSDNTAAETSKGETAKTDSKSSPEKAKASAPPSTVPAQELIASVPRSSLSSIGAAAPLPAESLAAVAPAMRVSQGISGGKLIRRVEPLYPYQAKQQRIAGEVVLQALIGKDGRVHDVKGVRGNAMLTAAAVAAVRQWRYDPYKLNGDPVDMQTQIVIKFALP